MIANFQTAPQSVTVPQNVTLTITPTGTLEVDLNTYSITIENGGGIHIQTGGSLAQTGKLTPPQNGEEPEKKLIYHHTDHLSGASVDTDNNGNILQLTDYYPYGNERIEETTTDFHNDYTYTGKERDEDTDLLYYEARYYNSNIARFISIDPWAGDLTDPQSLNKYAYVRNNPLKYVDPTGNFFETGWDVLNVSIDIGTLVKNTVEIAYEGVRYGYGVFTKNESLKTDAVQGLKQDAKEFGEALFASAIDAGATLIPGLPGGAGVAMTMAKKGDDVVDGVKAVKTGEGVQKTVQKTSTINKKIYNQLKKQYKENGSGSVFKALDSARKSLRIHVEKVSKLEYKSQVQGTIKNVANQIKTIRRFIRRNKLKRSGSNGSSNSNGGNG
ncbi:RHS repeat-associated core domain-containing protein [Candidatus Peregrinibacteria bacterium]|nr:MAG: RHS repeat-associated core domain-containing protein [Candidatus Peregrinibacteria bacterium]